MTEALYWLADLLEKLAYVQPSPRSPLTCHGGRHLMTHAPSCRWERTTSAECEYRATHHYCPHAEHSCDCPIDKPAALSNAISNHQNGTCVHGADFDKHCAACVVDVALAPDVRSKSRTVPDFRDCDCAPCRIRAAAAAPLQDKENEDE